MYDNKFLNLLDKNLINSELIVKVGKHEHQGEVAPAHKTIFKASLKEIKTKLNLKYKVDTNRLKDEKEITITGPVKI